MTEQHRADGSLRHLLTLATLPRAELERLLERAQSFVRPLGRGARHEPHARVGHGGEPLHRALDAHARELRARRQAPGRPGRQSRSAAVLARQGREHARHGLHAAVAARGRVRDPRRRGRRAGAGGRARGAARERAVGRARRTCRTPPRGCSMRSRCTSASSASPGSPWRSSATSATRASRARPGMRSARSGSASCASSPRRR